MQNIASWKNYVNKIVDDYLNKTEINAIDVERIIHGFNMGQRFERTPENPLQQPDFYCPGLRAQPWHNADDCAWIKIIEENADVIIDTYQQVERDMSGLHPENNKLADGGSWNSLFFYRAGQCFQESFVKYPKLGALINSIKGTDTAGSVYYARLTPGAKIKPHYGPHNYRLRTHMGIKVPKNTFIEVGDVRKTWKVGKCIVFDDSFLHYVENNSDEERIVFILDVWHPDLTKPEINLIQYVMKTLITAIKSDCVIEGAPSSVLDFV